VDQHAHDLLIQLRETGNRHSSLATWSANTVLTVHIAQDLARIVPITAKSSKFISPPPLSLTHFCSSYFWKEGPLGVHPGAQEKDSEQSREGGSEVFARLEPSIERVY
jgi:hypothetical protein